MRIAIDYTTSYAYDEPSSGIVQALRLKPRETTAQHVIRWRIDADANGAMRETRDAFGNPVHMFYPDGALSGLAIRVRGEVETSETAGVLGGIAEPLPDLVYLRRTRLTSPDDALVDLAYSARCETPLETLHCLLTRIAGAMRFDAGMTDAATTAADAFDRRHGVCQDYAHIFITAARMLGFPARYISGHLARPEEVRSEAAHAWAEALVPDLGWVAFDATNGICADERYVRVAAGLDYLDAAPVRGARRGGGTERLEVTVRAVDAAEAKARTGR